MIRLILECQDCGLIIQDDTVPSREVVELDPWVIAEHHEFSCGQFGARKGYTVLSAEQATQLADGTWPDDDDYADEEYELWDDEDGELS